MKADFEFISALEIPTEAQFQDHLMALESDVLAIYQEEVKYGEISAQECEQMYANWLRKYRGASERRELRLPGIA